MKDHAENKSEETEAVHANGDSTKAVQENEEPSAVEQKQQQEEEEKIGDNKVGVEAATTEPKNDTQPTEATESKDEAKHTEANGNGNAVEPGARSDKDIASTILEKGIIYFFFRPRVNVDEPQDVNDVARSFMVLRPLPLDAKLGDGPIGDEKNCRLLVLPKKVLPKSGKDRFLTFVEKSKTSFADLKESFLTGSEYYTKTQGMKHTAPVTPLAEGIYAITSTGRESHLAYIINIPSTPGEVQKDFGLRERGSFVASVKNPDKPPTGQQQSLPQGPEYPSELIDEFRGLRWKPLEPKFLDYDNAQFLMIGEDFDKAIEERPKDDREGNVPAMQEMEKLEGEDEIRIKHLKGKLSTQNKIFQLFFTS